MRQLHSKSLIGLALIACCVVAPVSAHELWVQPTHFVPPGLGIFPWPTTGSGFASFGFAVPDDMESLTAATVVLIPSANINGTYDVYGNVKRDGELAGAGTVFSVSIPAVLSSGTVEQVDITGLIAPELDAASPGNDYVSVFFWFPTGAGLTDAKVLGLRFDYEPKAIDTNDIADGAITAAKLAANSVDNAKMANDSVGLAEMRDNSVRSVEIVDNSIQTVDLASQSVTNGKLATNAVGPNKVAANAIGLAAMQNNSVGSAEVVDGSLTAADLGANSVGASEVIDTQVQRRVASSCPAGQSIRAISSTGGVTCENDTIGMASYLRVTSSESCPANNACIRSLSCTGGRSVMGGGVHLDETFTFDTFDDFDLVESYPFSNGGWTVGFVNRNGFTADVVLYAVCSLQASGPGSSAVVEEGPSFNVPLSN